MTTFEILTLTLGATTAVVLVGGTLIAVGRGFESLKAFIVQKVQSESDARAADLKELRDEMFKEIAKQRTSQDNIFREIATALRTYIENVEKEMHKIEIWNRDNYARKDDVERAFTSVREDIKDFRTEVTGSVGDIFTKISQIQIDVARGTAPSKET